MNSFEELKQIIKNKQDKKDNEFINKLNDDKFKTMDDINNFVDRVIDSNNDKENLKKNIINLKEIEKDGYTFGITTTKSTFKDYKSLEDIGNDVPTITLFRTYMIINKDEDIIDNLFYKQFNEEQSATDYYNELIEYVQNSEVEDIFKKIKENL